jgi:hypothetical protein
MSTATLSPVDGKKSFYGKCRMITGGDLTQLKSYETIVAEYDANTGIMTINGWYSATTARHINSFLDHFGFKTMTKEQMLDRPIFLKY